MRKLLYSFLMAFAIYSVLSLFQLFIFTPSANAGVCSGTTPHCRSSEVRTCRTGSGASCTPGTAGCTCTYSCSGGSRYLCNACSDGNASATACSRTGNCFGVGGCLCVESGSCRYSAYSQGNYYGQSGYYSQGSYYSQGTYCPTVRPTGLTPNSNVACGSTSVTLRWNAVAGAGWYNISVTDGVNDRQDSRSNCANNKTSLVCINQWHSTSITITTIPGRNYSWTIIPNNTGCGGGPTTTATFGDAVCAPTCPTTPPAGLGPGTNTVYPASQTSVTMSWNAVPGAGWYNVRVTDGVNDRQDSRSNCPNDKNSLVCINQYATRSIAVNVIAGRSYTWTIIPNNTGCGGGPQGGGVFRITAAAAPTFTPTPTPRPAAPTATRTPTPRPPTPTATRTPTPAPASFNIGGTVFIDVNGNGAKDTGDNGYNGAAIVLSGTGAGNATTNGSGTYSFNNRTAGSYSVRLTVPSGYTATTTNPRAVTLGPTATVNFGIRPNAAPTNTPTPAPSTFNITGNVFVDTNRNGSKDSGEANSANRTLTLSVGGSASTTSNTSGNYAFNNHTAGSYRVTLTVPSAFVATTTNPRNFTLGPNATINFGIAPATTPTNTPTPTPGLSTITINVYHDNNGNGAKDGGENGHQNATVVVTGRGAGTYTTNASGVITLANLAAGNSTSTLTVPSGYTSTTTNPRTVTVPPNQTINFGIQPPAPTCSGGLRANPTVVAPGGTSTLTATGCSGPGTITYSWPAPDYGSTNNVNNSTTTWTAPNPFASSVTAHPSVNVCLQGTAICTPYSVNIQISPSFTIAGSVFVDANKDTLKAGGESNYTGSITITSSGGGTVSYPSSGNFQVANLAQGTYTVSYTNLPSGYTLTYPLNGPPPSFSVTVGAACSASSSNSASCNGSGSITNLNFGITNSVPWIQSIGGDITAGNLSDPSGGGFTSQIPAGASCGSYASTAGAGGTPGIIYTGASSANFGSGQASPNPYNWVVGGLTYPEVYKPQTAGVVRTSYNYIDSIARQSNITPVNIATVSGCSDLSNCVLPSNLANGIYKANGNLTLTNSGFVFPANKNFVILVNGDLTFKTEIQVPIGSTALFSASGNIYVDQTIGESVVTSTRANLEGYFSADKSFYVQGGNTCPAADKRLNVAGAIVTNAALGGGSFVNQRDLCAGDNQCPVFSITERPDFILYAPSFLLNVRRIWQEIAP